MRKKRHVKKKVKYLFVIFLGLLVLLGAFFFGRNEYLKKENKRKREEHIKLVKDSYNEMVMVSKDTDLYNDKFEKVGKITKDYQLKLTDIKEDYYQISNFDNKYYIKYTDVTKVDSFEEENNRYKKYIPFNQNVKTDAHTSFFDRDGNMVVEFDEGIDLPIIVKEKDSYGVIFDDKLMYLKKEIGHVENKQNTKDVNTKGIAVLNYHFVYEDNDKSCREDICVSESFFRKHMDYIKNNGYFTPTMHELEDYIDGKIQLPKSVVITFDDGRYLNNAKRILEEYKLNGTFFVISGWNFKIDFKNYHSDYLELHSHTHNMHDLGQCPTGQGGGIQCFSEAKIQDDLKKSRETLFGTTYLAYPFYEYNNYSIEQLKKAGFTMAFGGEYENGQKYVKPGINKYKLPRWVMVNWTSNYDFTSYLTLK